MKSVLISIQPKWVNKIVSGEKTIEVRKTRPKLETPFKCYIYETTAKYKTRLLGLNCTCQGKGKVIGEFVCDKIYNLFPFAMGTGIELLDELVSPEMFCKESCLTEQEICDYIGEKDGYGWHISNLKIYDKPKELSEFLSCKKCVGKKYNYCGSCKGSSITRPPQSWCYVESGD